MKATLARQRVRSDDARSKALAIWNLAKRHITPREVSNSSDTAAIPCTITCTISFVVCCMLVAFLAA
jgi:hypothetical protein